MKSPLLILFALIGLPPSVCAEGPRDTFEITYEAFSLPIKDAARLRTQFQGGRKMHAHLVSGIDQEKVRREKWMVLKMTPNDYVNSQQYEEFIYPAEN